MMLQHRTLSSYFSQWVALSVFSERILIVSLFLLIRLVGCLCIYISDIDNQLPGKPSLIKCQCNIKYSCSVSMRMRMRFFTPPAAKTHTQIKRPVALTLANVLGSVVVITILEHYFRESYP